MRQNARLVPVLGRVRVCRDRDDDMLIEVAQEGRADVLVSRDEDLARAPEVTEHLTARGVRTLTVRRFLEELARV